MEIKQAIILAAGYGSRMGNIGKRVPKSMWPLFDYSLLESQILFAGSLGIKNFFINTHYLAEKVVLRDAIKQKFHIQLVFEKELLGSGGAVHNIINNSDLIKNEPVLILNCDLFYMIGREVIEKVSDDLINSDAPICLFPLRCHEGEQYNRLILDNKLLKSISKKGDHSNSSITYSGVSLLVPDRLKKSYGKSAFFSTVANYREEMVYVEDSLNFENWDFGTSELYFKGLVDIMNKLKNGDDSKFIRFLISNKVINKDRLGINSMSYNTSEENYLDFDLPPSSRSLNRFEINLGPNPGIYFDNILDRVGDDS